MKVQYNPLMYRGGVNVSYYCKFTNSNKSSGVISVNIVSLTMVIGVILLFKFYVQNFTIYT